MVGTTDGAWLRDIAQREHRDGVGLGGLAGKRRHLGADSLDQGGEAYAKAIDDVMPERFMTVEIDRMNAMVSTGSRSRAMVARSADGNADPGTLRSSSATNANTTAMHTSVPAGARKSSRYPSGYGVTAAATGDARRMSGAGLTSDHVQDPGDCRFHTAYRKPCGAAGADAPTRGSGHWVLPG